MMAGYNDDSLSVSVRPKGGVRRFILYPEGLPRLYSINIHYNLDDLNSEIGDLLAERGPKIIPAQEIIGGQMIPSAKIYSPSVYVPWVARLNQPFLSVAYFLQKANERCSTCVAPVDLEFVESGIITPEMIPYHKKQKEHYCISDEGIGAPLIPSDVRTLNMGLNLHLSFYNRSRYVESMKKERVEELLMGIPLTINTEFWFDDVPRSWTNITLTMYDADKPFNEEGNGRLVFRHPTPYSKRDSRYERIQLEERIQEILPDFLRIYGAFKR